MEDEINIRLRLILDKEELTSSQFANIVILGRGEMYKIPDNVIDDKRESAVRDSINTRKAESEPDPLPYVSNVKVKTEGKVIVKVLVFYSDQTFTEYIPSEK